MYDHAIPPGELPNALGTIRSGHDHEQRITLSPEMANILRPHPPTPLLQERPNGERSSILFTTVAVGGGHVATARAMSEAIQRYFPGQYDTRVTDYAEELGVAGFDRRHKAFWRLALRYPFIARNGQRLIDSFPRTTVAAQRGLVRRFARAAAKHLERERPLLVVSNHGLLTTGLALAQKRYGLRVPVLTYATEPYNISAYWADPRADHIVVPAEDVRRDLISMGVPARKVSVSGYPVRQSFLEAPDKSAARRKLALEERFTCLVSLGGEGVIRNPRRLIDSVLNSKVAPQVVAITGRNAKLRRELESPGTPNLRVEGFVEEMALRVAASDVVIGKSGPASVYETLAVGRPMIVTGHAGLNELGVARFVQLERLGCRADTPAALSRAVVKYAEDPSLLRDVERRSRRLDLARDTERLAHHIVRYALGDKPTITANRV